ncbi:MAG: hypothetical protein ACI3ZN_11215 [Candidatus Cryptobacteroides sp.]
METKDSSLFERIALSSDKYAVLTFTKIVSLFVFSMRMASFFKKNMEFSHQSWNNWRPNFRSMMSVRCVKS